MGRDDIPDITPDLPPEEEAAVRDLLGSLGAAGSASSLGPTVEMPADVRDRLDAVIREQAAARAGAGAGHHVRRLAVAWLGAAAAVVVVVAGVGVVADQVRSGDDGAAETSMVQDSGGAGASAESAPSPSAAQPSELADSDATRDFLAEGTPVIRPDHLAEDAAALLGQGYAARVVPEPLGNSCVVPRTRVGDRQVFAVSYRGAPAVLLITDGRPRTASVWNCAGEELQSVELPE